jgi:hypothetical protein
MRITWMLGLAAFIAAATPAMAIDQVSREQDILQLRLGQRVQVDDGSCPTGQIKEIQGTTLTTGGITRTRKCVPRMGTKSR